jgi:hypothetical protein
MSPFASDKNNWEAELIQVSIIYTKNLSIDTSRAITSRSWLAPRFSDHAALKFTGRRAGEYRPLLA